ncbi:hypothetical protein PYW07_010647 [Mythimna separata]|uniref:Nicotinamide riboside kinase 1 n=1 Tax=Mythimna separata TaxID=271217 RepID=A0AAD8DLN5_MYTSE|nr:hypothetical protein PYW07_010647 [Mythimna separata]
MASSRNDWIIIGISGVTCGGKTSLANQLKDTLTPVHVFHQDKYFYPDDSPKHVRCEGLEHNNYDILGALDMETMLADINMTIKGQDRAHLTRTEPGENKFSVLGKRFLIAEGFTVLNYKPIMDMCDFRYYFVLEFGECVLRRSYRLYDPPDIAGYFEQCVWPEHIKYRAEIERDSRVHIIDGTQRDAYDIVMNELRANYK